MMPLLFRAFTICAVFLFPQTNVLLGEDTVKINYREQIKHFFAEQEVELHIDITSTEAVQANVSWALQAAKRPLAQNKQQLELSPEKPGTIVIKHMLPPLNEGVKLPLELIVRVKTEQPEQEATLSEKFYLHDNRPWGSSDGMNSKNILNLHLFDPPGTTAKLFGENENAFHLVTNLETLRE